VSQAAAASYSAPGHALRDEIVERALTLPLGNLAALNRVARLCGEPTATPAGVALEAARDEAFAALLLRLANSAHSHSVARIADLPRAVTRLGLGLVQGLALAAPGFRLLRGPADGLGEARRELHRHAVRLGLGAWTLAAGDIDPDEALAAGLVHNLGLNVLSMAAPDLFGVVVAGARAGVPVREIEEERLGFTHAELGGLVAERWSYPLSLVLVIRDHDAAEPTSDLGRLIRLCDLLARESGAGIEPPHPAALAGAERARERVRPVFEAHGRIEARPEEEGDAPRVPSSALALALSALA
jgi:HD-like signal output (HDOD) protein